MSCISNNGCNSGGRNSNAFNSNGFNSSGFNSGNCNGGNNSGNNSGNQNRNPNFVENLRRYVGENVTVFTTSGGASGCGFTGILLSVNQSCLRLVTEQGAAPANPLSESVCGDISDLCPGKGPGGIGGGGGGPCRGGSHQPGGSVAGSVCDIPLNRVAAVCHNAL